LVDKHQVLISKGVGHCFKAVAKRFKAVQKMLKAVVCVVGYAVPVPTMLLCSLLSQAAPTSRRSKLEEARVQQNLVDKHQVLIRVLFAVHSCLGWLCLCVQGSDPRGVVVVVLL
jgi:hypothetical protein